MLYIARVPGSKDVFLSPMKPRDKVVTAEDIQSSLYFVHVEDPRDALLVAPSDFRDPDYSSKGQPNQGNIPTIQRKAVPGAAGAPPMRKPVPGTLAPISNFDSRQNTAASTSSQRLAMPRPDYSSRRSFDSTSSHQENERPTAPPRRSLDRSQPGCPSLTLIRRDPASGAQWNVARIEDPPLLEISSSSLNDPSAKRKMGAPMYIDVFNPGYSKFLHSDVPSRSLSSQMPGQPYQNGQSQQPRIAESLSRSTPAGSENTFKRRIWMEGASGHSRKAGSNDYDRPISRGHNDSGYPNLDTSVPRPLQLSERQQPVFRGYVFTSPWNGRCEFVTGGGGGSLKCRHIIPGLQGAPPAAAQVSELRFNLPGSSRVATPRGEETSKRSSFFHRGRHSRNNSSVSVVRDDSAEDMRNSMDRLDLSLGQEFAGGGFGGKQAKLGKIIIEDEGLKMMDLLVAANLGLWWRAYERASSSRGDRGSF